MEERACIRKFYSIANLLRPDCLKRFIALDQFVLQVLQLPALLRTDGTELFQALGLYLQLPTHFIAGALCLREDGP